MDILTDLNRRLHGLRDHEHLTVECADLKAWRDEIKRLQDFSPKELPFPEKLFAGRRATLLQAVHKAGARGVTVARLFDLLYGDDPNGGPQDGANIISVYVSQINERLAKFALRVRCNRNGRAGGGSYVLEAIP